MWHIISILQTGSETNHASSLWSLSCLLFPLNTFVIVSHDLSTERSFSNLRLVSISTQLLSTTLCFTCGFLICKFFQNYCQTTRFVEMSFSIHEDKLEKMAICFSTTRKAITGKETQSSISVCWVYGCYALCRKSDYKWHHVHFTYSSVGEKWTKWFSLQIMNKIMSQSLLLGHKQPC